MLRDYRTIRCQVPGETGRAHSAPLPLAAYLEAFLLLEKTPRGRRDQPALMVALRRSVENGLRDAPIPPW